jgi:CO/xanthine dehydrogenase FAD-binding subunit
MATYLRPDTLAQALAALAADAASPPPDPLDRLTPLAGATDLYPAAATRRAWFQPSPRNILDLTGVSELQGITMGREGCRIGALATWTDIINTPMPPAFDALKQASRQVGGEQIQNRGTLAGNLCNASPAADGVPPLLALDAEVELVSARGNRRLCLPQFILGNRKTALQPGELVTAIHVPLPVETERSVFLKLGARAYLVISIASVAANVALDAEGRILRARLAVGACSAVPQRLTALEQQLTGMPLSSAATVISQGMLADLSPIDDVRATAEYRRQAALTLVGRALDALAQPLETAA